MSLQNYLFTSESVSEGHPDKVADQVSDAVVDAYIKRDPEARVAVETLVTTNRIILSGEVRCNDPVSKDELEELAISQAGSSPANLTRSFFGPKR